MKFWRNPEIRRELLVYAGIVAVALAGTGIMVGEKAAVCVLFVSVILSVSHFWCTYKRYRHIAAMADELDQILHDRQKLLIHDCEEGELAILSNQLGKLVGRLQEQADQLQKEKLFLADSLADISHQIKTPLTSIHLLLSFLKEEEVSSQRRREIAREIAGLLDRVDWLVYALLKMSRLDAGVVEMQKETVSVKELSENAYELIAVPMDIRGIHWEVDVPEQTSFTGDLSWSIEAVGNILKNCMEHTPEGGRIVLTGRENAIYTEIQIEDSGNGISPADLPHLFERFFRGEDYKEQSVGIGLSLSQKIIQMQNGTIQAKNGNNGGAVFCIRFYKTVV